MESQHVNESTDIYSNMKKWQIKSKIDYAILHGIVLKRISIEAVGIHSRKSWYVIFLSETQNLITVWDYACERDTSKNVMNISSS